MGSVLRSPMLHPYQAEAARAMPERARHGFGGSMLGYVRAASARSRAETAPKTVTHTLERPAAWPAVN